MLEKASPLINGLASGMVRWEATVADLEQQISSVTGACLLAAAFLYEYRDHMMNRIWFKEIRKLGIPCNPHSQPSPRLDHSRITFEHILH